MRRAGHRVSRAEQRMTVKHTCELVIVAKDKAVCVVRQSCEVHGEKARAGGEGATGRVPALTNAYSRGTSNT